MFNSYIVYAPTISENARFLKVINKNKFFGLIKINTFKFITYFIEY